MLKPFVPLFFIVISVVILSYGISFGQAVTQAVGGKIVSQDSHTPLSGESVAVLDAQSFLGSSTDLQENFRIEDVTNLISLGRETVAENPLNMEKEYLTLETLKQMELPPIIAYAIPIIIILIVLEYGLSVYENRKVYEGKDFFAALTIGVVSFLINAAIKFTLFAIVLFFYNLVPWSIPVTWWSYILCFIAIDFCRYWAHRIAHEQLFWWATHVTHHSSKQYNFSVSFRTSWVQSIKIIFFIPVALMGFHPVVFFVCHQLAVLYQFWIHTEMIKKLPAPIEFLFVTPSHHRVHHGTNPQYIDKNYGSSLIIWDRIFGTFEPEGEQPVYGITEPVDSYNPVYLVFHVYIDIYHALKKTRSFKEAWKLLFGKPAGLKLNPKTVPLPTETLEETRAPRKISHKSKKGERVTSGQL